jgi:acyl-coenzyme A thioesterase PaaI-like protein
MRPEQIPAALTAMVPFIQTVGLTLHDVGPGVATARLASRREVHNHLATVHAGALYTVGESASGAVVLGLLGDQLPGVFIALKGASVRHTKAKAGDLRAVAQLDGDAATVRADYLRDGKVDFDVRVAFDVEGVEVASIAYTWSARAPR